MKKKKLKAVLFDIDDTLYSTTEFARRARSNSVAAMIKAGLRLPHALVLKELTELIAEFTSNYDHHFDKLLLRIPKSSYQGINPVVLVAAAVIAYHETKFRGMTPFSDAVQLLKKLKRTNLIPGVISAGLEVKQAEKLLRLKLYTLFDPQALFISDQIGISKPNPKLYQRACRDLNVQPFETMYVGDNPLTDIDPANQIGMTTVLVARSGKYFYERGRTRPDYLIRNFRELSTILKKHFRIKV